MLRRICLIFWHSLNKTYDYLYLVSTSNLQSDSFFFQGHFSGEWLSHMSFSLHLIFEGWLHGTLLFFSHSPSFFSLFFIQTFCFIFLSIPTQVYQQSVTAYRLLLWRHFKLLLKMLWMLLMWLCLSPSPISPSWILIVFFFSFNVTFCETKL